LVGGELSNRGSPADDILPRPSRTNDTNHANYPDDTNHADNPDDANNTDYPDDTSRT